MRCSSAKARTEMRCLGRGPVVDSRGRREEGRWVLDVADLVKCPSSFRIKSKSHQLPIVIGPCSPENWQQADLNVRLHFLFRYAMQFSKSQDGNEVPGQGTSGGLTWAPRGRTLGSGCRRSR